ncbi:cytochrome C oxidase subunit IV family protein [Paenalkalicoccus suaedae]|uniref:Cytochrome C oxidase subunit IV family protein n=1 Tax=Paenalkalicoccus suaedae TaxID=2592382 RepID=A0A859FF10_9BACI|nr:cytochrome C oxidase subunit IV family protein [Paenalkalicoccus suaedae]QKS71551.1 cytochrome C oxidase subunit IV family protein [Paenalkalicoccus suaedae]
MSTHLDPSAPLQGSASKATERKLKQEARTQVVSYVFMIFITSTAFLTIATDIIPSSFGIPFILLLAGVQVVMQLYFFMHMKDKGTGWVNAMIWSGMFVAAITVATLMLLLGINKY